MYMYKCFIYHDNNIDDNGSSFVACLMPLARGAQLFEIDKLRMKITKFFRIYIISIF